MLIISWLVEYKLSISDIINFYGSSRIEDVFLHCNSTVLCTVSFSFPPEGINQVYLPPVFGCWHWVTDEVCWWRCGQNTEQFSQCTGSITTDPLEVSQTFIANTFLPLKHIVVCWHFCQVIKLTSLPHLLMQFVSKKLVYPNKDIASLRIRQYR